MRKFLLLLVIAIGSSFIASAQDFSNKGKDFYLCFPSHVPSGSNLATLSIWITSDKASSGTITMANGAFSSTFNIAANGLAEIRIPHATGHISNAESFAIIKKSIRVKVDAGKPPVVAYVQQWGQARSAATLLLPTNVLGKKYYSLNFFQNSAGGGKSQFQIIATKNNTIVEINPIVNGIAGIPVTVTFPLAGDMYQYQSDGDLTGTFIESVASGSGGCLPIAVFSGSSAAAIRTKTCNPTGDSYDPLFQQLYPASTWGKNFGFIPFGDYSSGNPYRVMAGEDNTNVYFDGILVATLNKGQFYQSPSVLTPALLTAPTYITADHPITVGQYAQRLDCSGSGVGDPDMVVLNPIEQNINDITIFSTRQQFIERQWINILIKTIAIPSFKISRNGGALAAPSGTWQAMPTLPGYSYLRELLPSPAVTSDSYRLVADSGFNAIAYGFSSQHESYAYSAGTYIKDLSKHLGVNSQYGIETESSVCTGAPFNFKVYFPAKLSDGSDYIIDSMDWNSSNTAVMSPNNFPRRVILGAGMQDSTTTVGGILVNWYSIPTPNNFYTFSTPGTYNITITNYSSGSDACGSEQENEFELEVTNPPVASFSITPGGCYAEPYTFRETTPQTPKGTYKLWWEFTDPLAGTVDVVTGIGDPFRTVSHIFTTPGAKTVRHTSVTTPGCLSDTLVQTINVPDLPNATIAAGITTTCINTTPVPITFTGTDGTAPYTFYYHITDAGGPGPAVSNTTGTVNAPTNVAGTFVYTLDSVRNTGSTACVRTIAGQQVTVDIIPDATIAIVPPSPTSGAASQTVCINTPIVDIKYNVGGSGTGAALDPASSFPPGVSGSFAGGVYTITGTPTVDGVYPYKIVSQGPCLKPDVTGTITVTADGGIAISPSSPSPVDQTVCINKPMLNIVFETSGSTTGIGTIANLPPGVSGSYNAITHQVTLTGTPTSAASSPYIYSIPTTGPCFKPSIGGTITVTPDGFATIGTPATVNQTVCVNKPIADIHYGWGGSATSATVTGLPPGVTGSIVGTELVIIGTPTSTLGSPFTYRVTPTGPCEVPFLQGILTVKDLPTATTAASATEVCLNTPTTITFTGSTGTAPYTYTYTFDDGSGPVTLTTNTSTINVPTATAGVYTYTLQSVQESSANACLNPIVGTPVTVTVNPLPNATIAGAITVCKDAPMPQVTFTGSGSMSLPYLFAYTINGAPQTPVPSDPVTGIATLNVPTNVAGPFEYEITRVTDNTTTACFRNLTGVKTTVNVKALPTASFATSATEVCLNAPQPVITFTGTTGTAPYIFTYTFNDGVNPPTTLTANSGALNTATVNVVTSTAGLFTYTLQSVEESSTNGCVNPAVGGAPISVRVNPAPTATVAASTISACRNTTTAPTITFTGANGTSPFTFTYMINGITQPSVSSVFPSNTRTVNVNTAVAGTFKYKLVSVSDGTITACSQAQTDEVDVTINELPTPSFTISNPNCEGETITFTSTSTPGSGTLATYDWDFGDASIHGTNSVETHTYATPGTYPVSLSVTNSNFCANTLPVAITPVVVHANPTAEFLVPVACVDDIAVFTSTSTPSDPIFSYDWDYGDGSLHGTLQNGSHQYATPNIYTVTLTITTTKGCKSVMSHNITINAANPTPMYSIANTGTLCSSDTVRLTNQSTVAFGDVTKLEIWWDNIGDPTNVVTENSPTAGQLFKHKYPTLQVDRNYEVRMRAYSGTLCFNDHISTITVYATPKVQFNPLPDACWDAAPYALTQGSDIGGVPGNGVYSGPGITGTNTFNPNTLIPGTVYTIKYTYTSSSVAGCFDTLSRDILVRDTATANFSFNQPVCDGSPITFKDESTAPAGINMANVTWNFGDGSPAETHPVGASVNHVFPGPNTYTVTVYNTSDYGCRSTSKAQQVKISHQPVPAFTPNETSVCLPNALVSFDNTSSIGDPLATMQYTWDFGDGSPTSSAFEPSHIYTGVGPWTVTLTVETDAHCIKTTTRVINFIHPQPHAVYTTNKPSLCIGDEAKFTDATDPLDGTTTEWHWKMGDGGIRNTSTFDYTYSTTDSFYVEFYIKNSQGCYSDTTNQLFAVYEFPVVDAGDDKNVLEGGSIKLAPTVSGQDLQYLWTPNTYLTDQRIKEPTAAIIKQDITYTLTVTGIGNCPKSDQVFIKVLKFPVIPNTITPNQDGVNDKWLIRYLDTYPDCKVKIFTRTGQVIFESTGYAKPWDGTMKGKPLPVDTYYYIIEPGSGREPITGYVTILK